jgi:hypothetical protein
MNKKGQSRKLICPEVYENDSGDYPKRNTHHFHLVTTLMKVLALNQGLWKQEPTVADWGFPRHTARLFVYLP